MTEPRPKTLTPEMAKRAAEAIVRDLIRDGHITEAEAEHATEQIAKHGTPFKDGYELAKELDFHCYWNCNFEIADILDGFSWAARAEIEAAQKEWAERNNIQPPHPNGTRVKWRDHIGTIDGVYEHMPAAFTIVADGDGDAGPPHLSRYVVNFEDVEAL